MREALLYEQGWVYFAALGAQNVVVVAALLMGAISGYKRRRLEQGSLIATR